MVVVKLVIKVVPVVGDFQILAAAAERHLGSL
jgi:hypothetical protein